MKSNNFIILFISMFFVLSGCAKKSPVPSVGISRAEAEQSMANAQIEIDEAEKVGADVTEPRNILDNAKKLLIKGNYNKAKREADRAGETARRLKENILAETRSKEDATAAIERARGLINKADSLGGNVSESEKILAEAKKEFDNENYTNSIELADRAAEIAQDIINSLKSEKYIVGTWERNRECLWNIAGKKKIYNDSWKWKRIYMANRDKIKDPDLIYPEQVFIIPKK